MIVSVYTDDKKNKVAEFYDTQFPCSFLRGVLEETREDEAESQLMFVCRRETGIDYNKALIERAEYDEQREV